MQKLANGFLKYKWFLIAAQIFLCLLLGTAIRVSQSGIQELDLARAELAGGQISGEGYVRIDETDEAFGIFAELYTEPLQKGCYQVWVEYETGYDDNGFLIQALSDNPHAINQDVGDEIGTIPLKSQHNKGSAHVWVEEVTGLKIGIHFCGGGYLTVKGVTLKRLPDYTPALILPVLFAAADFLLWELCRVPDLQERKRRYLVRGGVLLIALIASIPLMNRYILMGYDQGFHLFRIEGIAEGLLSGQFPVRIMPQWWNEHGYGVSMFYGDVLLYFPALLLLLHYKLQTAFKCYIALINFLTAWIAYKSFHKIVKDDMAALAGSALYTWNLFRFMNLYVSNSVGNYTAAAFLPLVAAGVYLIAEKRGWIYLALGLTGCIQSHMMTCEMIAVFMILFLVCRIKWFLKKQVFLGFCKAGTAVLLWNLWFLVPFLNLYPGDYKFKTMDNFTENIQKNGTGLTEWLRYVRASFTGTTDTFRIGLFVGMAVLTGLLFVMVTVVIKGKLFSKTKEKILLSVSVIAGIMAVISLVLASNVFPYDFLCEKGGFLATLIRSLQFPWRFFEMTSVFAVTAIICALTLWKKNGHKKIFYAAGGILLGLCMAETAFYFQRILVAAPNMSEICEYYAISNVRGAEEYLPEMAEDPFAKQEWITSGEAVTVSDYEKQYTTIQMECKNLSAREEYIDVPLFFYPCYKAKDMQTGDVLSLTYGENGTIRIMLPPGYQGMIRLQVNARMLWKLAGAVSLFAIFISICHMAGKNNAKIMLKTHEREGIE